MSIYREKCINFPKKVDTCLDTFSKNSYCSDTDLDRLRPIRERIMRKIVFGISLLCALAAVGCASSQLHQSLLLQENRRLEDALYVSHSQVVDLKRENDWLRSKQGTEMVEPPGRSYNGSWEEEFDLVPPFEMPKVILPSQPGTEEVPEALRSSDPMPVWKPRR